MRKEEERSAHHRSSIAIRGITAVRMTTATRTTSGVPVWVLDDHGATSHTGDVLGGAAVSVPIGWDRRVRGHVRRHRVDDLLLGLDVYRHRLRVPVLSGL